MQQRCRSCNSAVVAVLVLLTWCDSTVDHVTVPLLMWRHCRSDTTALLIMQQCRCWCVGPVDIMQQHCWSWYSAVVDVTALSMWCDSAVHHATALLIMQQSRGWCDGTVDMIPSYKQWKSFTRTIYPTLLKWHVLLLCTVFISMLYARPCVDWSYQSIFGLLKPCLETAATGPWWAEERREKEEV